MTCLLSDPSEFTGGDLLFSEMGDSKPLPLKQGQAIIFASFLRHKVAPVKKGGRKSLVMWFGGPPFKRKIKINYKEKYYFQLLFILKINLTLKNLINIYLKK